MTERSVAGQAPTGQLATGETARSRGVLIVDDQELFRSVARSVVSLVEGWRVIGEAGSGEDAVSAAARLVPDVVIMDINLPGISGIEATRKIVDAQPKTRVVLVSTYAPEDLPADALVSGAVGYLRKEQMSPRSLTAAATSGSAPDGPGSSWAETTR